jgi:hypothetical protein
MGIFMKPSVALLGFLFGSSGAICFGLFGVAFVFWFLGPEYPQLRSEVGPLLNHLGRFTVLTAVAGASLYGVLRQRPWRRPSVAVTLLVLAAVTLSYLLADG